ncbi:chromosome segregation ATPase [Colwellia sp. Bg11-12]|uniref:chromosome segregation ATPase n=1 Tax=Colwellia sp. Bg11-12 TaxID=2759817 RepID=UPI0015F778A9|nr:chromosome segregation ATPase [Colwellia sp. Bg11-12]MBA6262165.1 chromosome segregation ATPase [Colwellia sp. Bg11-12]
MTSDQFESILNFLLRYGFEAVVAGTIVFFLIKYFLPGYLSQKGKNLATQEDIENITNTIESVKAGYAEVLEEIRSNNQIKIAAIEREKSIKKEVYMEAAEAITKAQNIVANFSDLNIDVEIITANFSAEAGKIAKVQIVGSGKTVKAVTMIMSSIGEAIFTLMLGRSPLIQRKNLIAINEKVRDKANAEVERYLSIMKNLNIQGNSEQVLWDTINRSIDYENDQIKIYSKKIDALWEVQSKEHLEYAQKCMNKFFEVSAKMPDAILAVRDELDLDISPDEYLEIYNDNIENGKKIFSDFIQQVPNS